jgi:hypothetical protein
MHPIAHKVPSILAAIWIYSLIALNAVTLAMLFWYKVTGGID